MTLEAIAAVARVAARACNRPPTREGAMPIDERLIEGAEWVLEQVSQGARTVALVAPDQGSALDMRDAVVRVVTTAYQSIIVHLWHLQWGDGATGIMYHAGAPDRL